MLVVLNILLILATTCLFLVTPNGRHQLSPFSHVGFTRHNLRANSNRVPRGSLTTFQHTARTNFNITLSVRFATSRHLIIFRSTALRHVYNVRHHISSVACSRLGTLPLRKDSRRVPLLRRTLRALNRAPLIYRFGDCNTTASARLYRTTAPVLSRCCNP